MSISARDVRVLVPSLLAGAALLAACSSGSSGSGTPAGGGATTSVSIRSTSGGDVLADQRGRTVYFSDQERTMLRCISSACAAIWTPVTVSGRVTAPSGLRGTLGAITRPDGGRQVTLDGRPLYTFSFDHSAGETGGDNVQDSFDGVHYTWHAATASGTALGASASSPAGGYGY